jgi:hypothetical protein
MTKLCPRGKAAAKRKFKVYPSAYANAYASKICAGKARDPSGVKRKDFKGPKPAGKAVGGMAAKGAGKYLKRRLKLSGLGSLIGTGVSKAKKRDKAKTKQYDKKAEGGSISSASFPQKAKGESVKGYTKRVKSSFKKNIKKYGVFPSKKELKDTIKNVKAFKRDYAKTKPARKAMGGVIDSTKFKYV